MSVTPFKTMIHKSTTPSSLYPHIIHCKNVSFSKKKVMIKFLLILKIHIMFYEVRERTLLKRDVIPMGHKIIIIIIITNTVITLLVVMYTHTYILTKVM